MDTMNLSLKFSATSTFLPRWLSPRFTRKTNKSVENDHGYPRCLCVGNGEQLRGAVKARPHATTVVIRSCTAKMDGKAGIYLRQMLGAVFLFNNLAEVRLDLSRFHIGAFKYLLDKDTKKLNKVSRLSLTLGRSKCGG